MSTTTWLLIIFVGGGILAWVPLYRAMHTGQPHSMGEFIGEALAVSFFCFWFCGPFLCVYFYIYKPIEKAYKKHEAKSQKTPVYKRAHSFIMNEKSR